MEVLLYIQASQEFSQAFQGFYPAFLRQRDIKKELGCMQPSSFT
ncbi:hypothetical protein HMPREF1492_0404 [Atopobium sp. BS2]|nr:hypothetical protein HMPREF1492_0404 [Atopobium sp. BS2]